MIVAILLSYLKNIGRREHFRDVFLGVATAFVFILGAGVAAFFLIKQYDGSKVQTYFETATYVLATAVLTYMTFWMQRHARSLTRELERQGDQVMTRGSRWGLGLIAFQAVGREGVETMVFTLAIIFASAKQAATPVHGNLLLLGAVLGLLVSLAIAFGIYKLGARLNMRRFFTVMGVALMTFAAGLLADAIQNLQELGWLPFGQHALWNSSGLLMESSNIGDVFHTLLGYADQPTILQVGGWTAYLVICVGLYSRWNRHSRGSRVTSSEV